MTEQSPPESASSPLFPGESPEYRQARNRLLAEERKLQAQVLRVAALRAQLPLGGEVPRYALTETDAAGASRQRLFADLFASGRDALVLLSVAFGADGCEPEATSALAADALQSQAVHLLQRCNLALITRAPAAALSATARRRGWSRLRALSYEGTRFGADYRLEAADGKCLSTVTVFARRAGKICHYWSAELLYDPDSQSSRHLDLLAPLWAYLDLTPDGRHGFLPKLDYSMDLRDTLVSPRG